MNIGLMGGTFNPVHLAHLRIAEEARDWCGLHRITFIPAADPPHKPLSGGISFEQRCEMVRLAIADNPAFEFSDLEGKRTGKSYSIDTVEIFAASHPGDELFFIIGGDSYLEFGTWHRYAEFFNHCSLIVVERPGCLIPDPLAPLPVAIREEFRYTAAAQRLEHRSGRCVQVLRGCPLDISSTEIRRLVTAGRSISYLVPPNVEAYIKKQRIYTECP